MKLRFPHFSQFKTARLFFGLEMAVLWFGLAALVTINILTVQKGRQAHWNKLMMLFEAPFSVDRHIDLASLLWKEGNKKEARQLMASARAGSVLGATIDPQAVLTEWEHEVDQHKEQYAFWQTVAAAKPDYRDAFITLTGLAYQLGYQKDARAWLTRAQALDPNSHTAHALQELLK